MNKFRIIFILMFLLVMSCKNNKKSENKSSCPVINLVPLEAELKLSDICDGYKIFTLKGQPLGMCPEFTLSKKFILSGTHLFDLEGNYKSTLGRIGRGPGEYLQGSIRRIAINENTVDLYSTNKKMTFSFEGKLLKEKRYNISQGKFWNYRGYFNINKEYLLLHNDRGFPGKYSKPEYKFWYYSLNEDRFTDSLRLIDKSKIVSFPGISRLYSCRFYKFKDTLRYNVHDSLYSIIDKKFELSYLYNRGEFKGEYGYHSQTSNEGYDSYIRKSNKIYNLFINESSRHLFCKYNCKGKNYLSVYDKQEDKNQNFDRITDDLVFMKKGPNVVRWKGIEYSMIEPNPISRSIISDDYLFYTVHPISFKEAIDDLKKRFNKKDWNRYRVIHKDVMDVYNTTTEESNEIIVGYRFKK